MNDSHVPSHPSNRTFIAKMIAWGWEPGKSNGNWLRMTAPPLTADTPVMVEVRPAIQHEANPSSVFKQVVDLTTNGDSELFWRGPSPAYVAMLTAAVAAEHQRERDATAAMLARAEARAAQAAQANAPVTVPNNITEEVNNTMNETLEISAAVKRAVGNPRIKTEADARMVLQVLVNNGGPMTVSEVCAALGHPGTSMHSALYYSVNGRMAYLTKLGTVMRMSPGVYQAKKNLPSRGAGTPGYTPKKQTTNAQKNAARTKRRAAARAAAAKPTVVSTPAVVPATEAAILNHKVTNPALSEVDGVIEAVLDLLLPEGFKARHLAYITPWVDTTKKMVEAVLNG